MSDRILGAVCVFASAGMAWAARDYAAAISYEPVGPRAFPLLLAGLMAVGGGWLVLRPTLRGGVFRGVPLGATAFTALAVLVYGRVLSKITQYAEQSEIRLTASPSMSF